MKRALGDGKELPHVDRRNTHNDTDGLLQRSLVEEEGEALLQAAVS